jgi:hypothetical protein
MELTVSVAVLLTAPVADSLDETPPVVLLSEPGTVLVTWTVMVQLELAAMMAPDRVSELAPALGDPLLQLLVAVGVLLTTRLVGKVSVKPTPVSAMALEFVITRLNVDVPLVRIVDGLNDFAMVGAVTTCKIAVLLVLYVPVAVDNVPVVLA